MAKSLSRDLRERVIAAVEGGMSRHAAAERFGVSAASAVRWVRRWRDSGLAGAERQGGDRRSRGIEAFAATILAAVERRKDITLVEIAALLRDEHGVRFAPSTIWRFLDRHAMTFKKHRAFPRGVLRFRKCGGGAETASRPAQHQDILDCLSVGPQTCVVHVSKSSAWHLEQLPTRTQRRLAVGKADEIHGNRRRPCHARHQDVYADASSGFDC